MLLLSYKPHLQYIKKKTPIYNTWHYLTYLQYAIPVITHYDLHITLLKELQYNVIT